MERSDGGIFGGERRRSLASLRMTMMKSALKMRVGAKTNPLILNKTSFNRRFFNPLNFQRIKKRTVSQNHRKPTVNPSDMNAEFQRRKNNLIFSATCQTRLSLKSADFQFLISRSTFSAFAPSGNLLFAAPEMRSKVSSDWRKDAAVLGLPFFSAISASSRPRS